MTVTDEELEAKRSYIEALRAKIAETEYVKAQEQNDAENEHTSKLLDDEISRLEREYAAKGAVDYSAPVSPEPEVNTEGSAESYQDQLAMFADELDTETE